MCLIRPKSDDIISIVGNQDLWIKEEKIICDNNMIKIKGFEGCFNLNDFELIE
jgi:hypothetical protein